MREHSIHMPHWRMTNRGLGWLIDRVSYWRSSEILNTCTIDRPLLYTEYNFETSNWPALVVLICIYIYTCHVTLMLSEYNNSPGYWLWSDVVDVLSYDEFVSSDSEVRVAREVVRHKRQMNGPFPGPVTTTDAIKPNIRPTVSMI